MSAKKSTPKVGARRGRNARMIVPLDPNLQLPMLGSTHESVLSYLNAVAAAVSNGKLDARFGDSLIGAAKAVINTLRERHKVRDIDELRAMLEEARTVQADSLANEVAHREHRQSSDCDCYSCTIARAQRKQP